MYIYQNSNGLLQPKRAKDQIEADINVPFLLILQAKQGNLDISLSSLVPPSKHLPTPSQVL